MKADIYERDLDDGYHEKGTCMHDPKDDDGCIIFDLFSGFGGVPGKLSHRPLQFSPVRSASDYTRSQAEGHCRRLNRNVVSRNEYDNRKPLWKIEVNAVGNLEKHSNSRLGSESRNSSVFSSRPLSTSTPTIPTLCTSWAALEFGAGIVDCELINPLYEQHEIMRVFDRAIATTAAMEKRQDVGRKVSPNSRRSTERPDRSGNKCARTQPPQTQSIIVVWTVRWLPITMMRINLRYLCLCLEVAVVCRATITDPYE